MKKIISVLLLLVFCLSLVSCNTYDSAKLKNIVGTYKLTTYTKQKKDTDQIIDLIEENSIESYLIIQDEITGYYYYKDKDSVFECKEVRLTMTKDPNNENKFMKIEYKDAQNNVKGTLYVQDRKNKLTYKVYPVDLGFYETYYYWDTEYSFVNKAKDLDAFRKAYNIVCPCIEYDDYKYHGVYELEGGYSSNPEYPYVYNFYNFDMANKVIYHQYMLKEDEKDKIESFVVNFGETDDFYVTQELNGKTFNIYSWETEGYMIYNQDLEYEKWNFLGDYDIKVLIENALYNYNYNKAEN